MLLLQLVTVFVADFLKVWTGSEDCDLHEEQLVVVKALNVITDCTELAGCEHFALKGDHVSPL